MAAATAAAVAALVIGPAVTAAGAGVMVVYGKEEGSPRLAVRLLVLPVRATEAVPIILRNPVRRTMTAAAASLGQAWDEGRGTRGVRRHPPPPVVRVGIVWVSRRVSWCVVQKGGGWGGQGQGWEWGGQNDARMLAQSHYKQARSKSLPQ